MKTSQRPPRADVLMRALRACAVFALAGVGGALMAPQSAEAHGQRAPWCVNHDGMTDCSYFTLEQCEATASGLPAYCSLNLRAGRYVEAPRHRRHRHRRHY